MGGKNKDKNASKRRQRDSMKKIARSKEIARRPPMPPPRHGVHQISSELFPDEDYWFWLAHGVNCVVSDYDQGIWSPLVEDLYTEGYKLGQDDLLARISDRYGAKDWPVEGKAALAWAASERTVVYIYMMEAMRRMQTAYPDDDFPQLSIRKPHNPVVWELFNFMKGKLLSRGAK